MLNNTHGKTMRKPGPLVDMCKKTIGNPPAKQMYQRRIKHQHSKRTNAANVPAEQNVPARQTYQGSRRYQRIRRCSSSARSKPKSHFFIFLYGLRFSRQGCKFEAFVSCGLCFVRKGRLLNSKSQFLMARVMPACGCKFSNHSRNFPHVFEICKSE